MSWKVEDLSLGGLFIQTSEVLPPGSRLAFTLFRDRTHRGIHLKGTVVNTRRWGLRAGIGVRFDPVAGEQRDRLVKLLADLGLMDPTTPEEGHRQGPPRGPRRPSLSDTQPGLPMITFDRPVEPPPAPEAPSLAALEAQLRAVRLQLREAEKRIVEQARELARLRQQLADGAPRKPR